MSDAAWIAFFAALPATIAAIAAAIVTVSARRHAVVAATEAVKSAQLTDSKLDHITLLTNSTLSAANARIATLEAIVETMTAERDREAP